MKKNILFILTVLITTHTMRGQTFLIFGGNGWIGQKISVLIQEQGHTVVYSQSRLEEREKIQKEIEQLHPDFIINAAGITGRPNVDWCETHRQETLRTNVLGTLNLVDLAYLYNIHVTNISTGCIYEYDAQHPMYSGIGFTEEEEPNFGGSFYSRTKIILEKLILEYPNVLNLRVKMPISTELDKGFVGKIIRYKKLINVPNSLCILDDLLPVAVEMTLKKFKGNYNFVNPGTMSHNEVLDLYKEYIDPTFTYENFTVEEQDKILKARRANAELSAKKLLQDFPTIPPIRDSLIAIFKKIHHG
jgi:dTDP-4-dehydrorhamnose reductase